MKTRLTFSWFFLIAGAAGGAYLAHASIPPGNLPLSALQGGYSVWALYWGFPVVFNLWKNLNFGYDFAAFLFKLFLGCALVPVLGWFYSVFGGGIYQFLKAWWQTRERL